MAEHVFVGTAIGRRSDVIPPTIDITATGQELTIDGVRWCSR